MKALRTRPNLEEQSKKQQKTITFIIIFSNFPCLFFKQVDLKQYNLFTSCFHIAAVIFFAGYHTK